MANVATLGAKATFDVSHFMGGVRAMNSGVSGFVSNTKGMRSAILEVQATASGAGSSISSSMAAGAVGAGVATVAFIGVQKAIDAVNYAGSKLFEGMKWGAQLAMEAENAQVAFEVMLKSVDKARNMMSNIEQFALATPFSTQGVTQNVVLLKGMGIATEDLLPAMKTLGDMAMGNNEKLGGLALAYGQVMAKGKLMAQEFNQFAERGINLRQSIANNLKIPISEVAKAMEEGKVSAAVFRNALVDLHATDFSGMMEKTAETTSGKLEKITEKTGILFEGLAEEFARTFDISSVLDAVDGGIDKITKSLNDLILTVKQAHEVYAILQSTMNVTADMNKRIFSNVDFRGIGAATGGIGGTLFSSAADYFKELTTRKDNFQADAKQIMDILGRPEKEKVDVMKGLGKVPEMPTKNAMLEPITRSIGTGLKNAFFEVGSLLSRAGSATSVAAGMAGNAMGAVIPANQPQYTPTAAIEAGSSEAFSAIIRNMMGANKTESAQEKTLAEIKKSNEYLRKLAERTASDVQGLLGLVPSFVGGSS